MNITPDTSACGQCIHCDQLHSGLYRQCDIRKGLVFCLNPDVCGHYESVWNKDLFGITTWEKIIQRNKK